MKLRDATWAVVLGALGNLLYRLFIQPWIEPVLNQPLDRFLHALGLAVASSLPILASFNVRKLLPMVRGLFARHARRHTPVKKIAIPPITGGIVLSGHAPVVTVSAKSPEPMPAGTPSAIATAMQMPPPPGHVNTSFMTHWQVADHLNVWSAQSVIDAHRRSANAARFDQQPYPYVLYGVAPPYVQQPWSAQSAAEMHGRSLQ